jgi:ribosomal protein S18 acetylase RimI-like enzyme
MSEDELTIEWFDGPREELAELFALADDSAAEVERYRDEGRVLVARERGAVIGHLQLLEPDGAGEAELKSLAVLADEQGRGIGRRLVERAKGASRDSGYARLLVATAAADTRVLRFYQLLGFRMLRVERDAFTPEKGYSALDVDGIPLRDRLWLSLDL